MTGFQCFAWSFSLITICFFNSWVEPLYFICNDLYELPTQKNLTCHRENCFPICGIGNATMTAIIRIIEAGNIHCCECACKGVVIFSRQGEVIFFHLEFLKVQYKEQRQYQIKD